MYEVENTERYITSDVAETCLKLGGVIDKTFTGNGFTTAFSNIINASNKPDVLIVPNISTATNKKENKNFAKGKRVLYFHSESSDIPPLNYSNIDLLVCVADSYVHRNIDKIDTRYILLDEDHTAKIQSGFRPNLWKMFELLKHKRNVSFVTATPYELKDVIVKINNTHEYFNDIKKVDVSYNLDKTIKEIQETKGRILIASNEAKRVCHILESVKENDVNLMCGKGFRRTFLQHSKFNITKDARITIMTTSAFEGHDILTPDTSVFVLQNYESQHAQYLDSQIIQALGRPRLKPKKLHICWLGGVSGRRLSNSTIEFKEEIQYICEKYCDIFNKTKTKRIESEDFQFSYKNNKIRLGSIRELIIYEDSEFKEEKMRVAKVNYIACDVLKKKINISNDGLNDDYFNTRGYLLNRYIDKPKGLKNKSVSVLSKTRNLIYNAEHNPNYISKNELIKWCFKLSIDKPFMKVYMLVKAYLKDEMPTRLDVFFKCFKNFEEIIKRCIQKVKEKNKADKKKMPSFDFLKDEIFAIISCMIRISKPQEKIRAFRNYNPFTTVGANVINYLSSLFGTRKISFDISACAPSVIQGLAGVSKKDVYQKGVGRKQSKRKINTLLNSIYKRNRTSERALSELRKTNFCNESIEYIKDVFYGTDKSDLIINTYSYYEREIINQAVRMIKGYINNDTLLIVRHDEINVFYSDETEESIQILQNGLGQILANIECLGFKNWFGYEHKIEGIKSESIQTKKQTENKQFRLAI